MDPRIQEMIEDSIAVKQQVLQSGDLLNTVEEVIAVCITCFKQDGKVLFCGNGGSAADAQHLAAELSGRFYFDRPPLFAEAMHVNTSFLTAVTNDYSFAEAYARMVKAAGRKGDVLFAMSTSGNSSNIVNAAKAARDCGMLVVGMTGATGGDLAQHCQYLINIPSSDTPRIQEAHMMLGHLICELVEKAMFDRKS
ncbi:MAG: phosphoheptose isomerase [Saprospiraceae bacterium]|nr:MAG: phosphoheptose isomerase [Saprospiraceae bacterium]